jgi:hypothetical protein
MNTKKQVLLMEKNEKSSWCRENIDKKFGKHVKYDCDNCAINLIFDDGEITDDELREIYVKNKAVKKLNFEKNFYKDVFKKDKKIINKKK